MTAQPSLSASDSVPAPTTARVHLLPLSAEHAPAMFRWMSDPHVRRNVGVRRDPSLEATLGWIAMALASPVHRPFAIYEGDRHVGNVVLDELDIEDGAGRLSIYIGEAADRGRGLGGAAIQECLMHAFQTLYLSRVRLTVHGENAAAIRLYRKLGFKLVSVAPRAFSLGNRQVDELSMNVDRGRFERLHANAGTIEPRIAAYPAGRFRSTGNRGPHTAVILQPSYIPWRGYFHQMQRADTFVFLDDVQYDKHGWRNRNRIKGPNGSQWLTIPVEQKGVRSTHKPIREIRIDRHRDWRRKHWETLRRRYGKTPFFSRYAPELRDRYERREEFLADFTIELTLLIAGWLGINTTRFLRSSSLGVTGVKTDRLIGILQRLGAGHYLTGPTARAYLDERKLTAAGISFEYQAYDYPEYPQLYPPYDPFVSVVDLLFMMGPDAENYIWRRPTVSRAAA